MIKMRVQRDLNRKVIDGVVDGRFLAAAILCVFFAFGCSSYDRVALTQFEPLANGSFRYKAVADAVYPLESAGAEAERIRWLEKYLKDNSLCPNGYKIEERKAVLKVNGLLGDGYDVFYLGKCSA